MFRVNFAVEVIVFIISSFSYASAQTLYLEENFNYTVGALLSSNGWTEYNSNGTPITIDAANLTFNNYPSSSGGSVLIDDDGVDYLKSIGTTFSSGNVFVSLLINVSEATTASQGDVIFSLGASGSSYAGRLYIEETGANEFDFGISKKNSDPTFTGNSYLYGVTYLIVIKYLIIEGSKNDGVELFVIDNAIPVDDSSPTVSINSDTTTSDPSNISVIILRQDRSTNIADIDGIRVSDSWTLAPLPVELSTITADCSGSNVELNWRTETEVNNYGFEIQRTPKTPLSNGHPLPGGEPKGWDKIGFVKGAGSSNSANNYKFVDDNLSSGIYSYRLKQIDTDGAFKYSRIVSVKVDAPAGTMLFQNYPNPFNPSTRIRYSLSSQGRAVMKIYDALGREVADLFDEDKPPGNYYVDFNSKKAMGIKRLAGGIYFCVLRSGSYIKTMKMVLQK